MTREVVLLGLESRYAHDVIDILESAGIRVAACASSEHDSEIAGSFPRLTSKAEIRAAGAAFVVPLLTPGRRRLRVEEGVAMGMVPAPVVLHASAVASPSARLGSGTVVGALVAIASHVVAGAQFLANRACSVGHDCRLGDFCTVGPGATLCGACRLEDGVFVGAGAVLRPGVRVGRNAVIGAGAVVVRDVAPGEVVAGNPARVIRRGVAGYRDIGV